MAADLGGFTDGSAIRDLAASPCAACGRAIGGEAEEEAAEVVRGRTRGWGGLCSRGVSSVLGGDLFGVRGVADL